MAGALDGFRVIDMSTVLMGPSATQVLGDFGADVIKVEPLTGDTSRYVGAALHDGMAGGFLHANRNKRSIALDLKCQDGREALLRLVANADVLMYNVRPQSMARLGLGYEEMVKLNPKLIYCGMYGFGEGGPYRGRPAYDDLIQALSGMSSLMAEVGDGVPRYLPVLLADRASGQAAVNTVLAALLHRERTGRGQSIEVAMFEVMVPFVLGDHMGGETFVPAQGEMGYRRVLSKARKAFPTTDGHVAAVVYTDKHWLDFLNACGQPQRFAQDPRLHGIAARTRNIDALYEELSDIFATRSTAEWLDILERADIPCARVHTLHSLLDDPHLNAVGFFQTHDHPTEGPIRSMAPVGTWSETQPSVRRLAPRLGEHTREVLSEIGYDEAAVEQMLNNGSASIADACS
jgi:crotonobetainyl-CoA:carnitine CoA-transferase CaiB-like acyl-CoA transferase